MQWLHERWARIESTPEINAMNHTGHEAILAAAWEHIRTTLTLRGAGPSPDRAR